MLRTSAENRLSIKGIEFSGDSPFRNQQRGSDVVTIKYAILTKVPTNSGDIEWVPTTYHEAKFNGQFKDEEFKEAIIHFKTLAVKFLQEANSDAKAVIDDAIERINKGK